MKKKKTISIGKVFFNVPVALILIIIAGFSAGHLDDI